MDRQVDLARQHKPRVLHPRRYVRAHGSAVGRAKSPRERHRQTVLTNNDVARSPVPCACLGWGLGRRRFLVLCWLLLRMLRLLCANAQIIGRSQFAAKAHRFLLPNRYFAAKKSAATETTVNNTAPDLETIPPPKTVYDREKGVPMGPTVWGPAGYQTSWILSDYDYHPEDVLYRKELFRTKKLYLSNISAIKKPLYERELDRFKRKYSQPILEAYHRMREEVLPHVRAEHRQAMKQRRAQLKQYRSKLPPPRDTSEQNEKPLSAEQMSKLSLSTGLALEEELDALMERFVEVKFDKLSVMLEDPAMEELMKQPAHVFDYTLMEEEMWDYMPQELYARGFDHTRTWWFEDDPSDLFLQDVLHWHKLREYRQAFAKLNRFGLRTLSPKQIPPELNHPLLGARAAGQAPSQLSRARFTQNTEEQQQPDEGAENYRLYEMAEKLLKQDDERQQAAEIRSDPDLAAEQRQKQKEEQEEQEEEAKASITGTLDEADLYMTALQLKHGPLPVSGSSERLRTLETYRLQLQMRIEAMSSDDILRAFDPTLAPPGPRAPAPREPQSDLRPEENEIMARVQHLMEQARARAFLDRPYDAVFSRRYTLSAPIPGRPDVRRMLMLRHRRVKLLLNVDRLKMPPLVMERFRELAGIRYNPASRILTVTSDQRENYWQNYQRAKEIVRDLLRESYLAYPRFLPLEELAPPAPRLYEPPAPTIDAKPIDAHILFRLKPHF